MIRPLLVCFFFCVAFGRGKPAEGRGPEVRGGGLLSRLKHDDDDGFDYDHEAFLGEDEASKFDQLPLEESLRRLRGIVHRIDVDRDHSVSVDELKLWIKAVQRNQTFRQMDAQWTGYDSDGDGLISWDEYQHTKDGGGAQVDQAFNYSEVAAREERRFRAADADGDLKVDKQEFNAFLHPDNYQHMREVLVQEMMDDMDLNRDGFIDLSEFIGYLFTPEDDGDPPDGVEEERRQFLDFKDKNKDGKLDRKETMEWMFESDMSFAEAEARHLVAESDSNQDGELSETEILNNHNMFVGSQATDFGGALLEHDEF